MKQRTYKRSVLLVFLQILLIFVPLAQAGKLAILIDDIGYRSEDNAIYQLPKEVSVAIIPVAPYATARANQAFAQKRDVLIHLPMQPLGNQPIESGALLVGMSEEQIAQLVKSAQQSVPHAIGMNNHMGSKATSDKQTMQHLMKALAQQHLFFLDSKTIGRSVAYQTAKEFGVNAFERNVFLDDSDNVAEIRQQFQRSIDYARKHGVAILIGHPRKHSIKVLQQGIANLPKEIELVRLSQLQPSEPVKPFIMIFDVEPALTSQPPYQAVPLLRGVPKE